MDFILYVIALIVVCGIHNIYYRFQKVIITQQEQLIIAYQERLSECYNQDKTVLIYCLRHIISESIKIEDYETAKKCRDLLIEFENAK